MLQLIRRNIPGFIKTTYRLLRYPQERRRLVREQKVRRAQDYLIAANYSPDTERLILFLVPGCNWFTGKDNISGGIMSIVSLCEETADLKDVHHSQVIMCTMNGEFLLQKHKMFENHTDVYRFAQVRSSFGKLKHLLIHLPEYMVEDFCARLAGDERRWLAGLELHINVLNQNIRLMPPPAVIAGLRQFTGKVTITTAHQKYCTKEYRQHFGVPLHKFSVWISPEDYMFVPWHEKENLLVVSPDEHPLKTEILAALEASGVRTQIIHNLTYQEYKKLIARAKWSLTFGEGLDGYFIEPVFSGAISFAVYNEQFFTPDFGSLRSVYPDMTTLAGSIVADLRSLDTESSFIACQSQAFGLCARYYSKETYRENIKAFYLGAYTHA